ncbi:MAG: hypothetical protein AB8G96_01015 [Phycisphaerales bacterium]
MQVLHDRFADDSRIQILAAHMGAGDQRMAGRESVPEYAEVGGYTYPMVADGRAIAAAFGVGGMPRFLVVGPDGTIVHEHRGQLTDEAREEVAAAAQEARANL